MFSWVELDLGPEFIIKVLVEHRTDESFVAVHAMALAKLKARVTP
jgi:hypothetical protein